MANPVDKIRTYYDETVNEVKKCSWPDWRQLREQTILVIIATVLLALFIALSDVIWQRSIEFIITGSF